MTMLILFALFLVVLRDEAVYVKARNFRQSGDGDIIDCVDIYKQPSFDHPALRNHTIQMEPIRKTRLLRNLCIKLGKETAALLVTMGYNYEGDINLCNPCVASPDEYTTAQIWLESGISDGFESIEAGWMVNPKLYGDTQTRLFIYWTTDAYKSTGCFDLTCTGLVQSNPKLYPVALPPDLVQVMEDPRSKNKQWWVKLGDEVVFGYWPRSLFYLKRSAILVEWGVEVYSPNMRNHPHPQTAMGSGEFAAALHGAACYIKGVRIVDYSMALKYAQIVNTWADQAYCYSAYNYIEGCTVDPVLYFGGPGRNSLCP